MKKFSIKYINRSGKSKVEINSDLDIYEDKLVLNGFVKKQVKVQNEEGKTVLKIEKTPINDTGEYKDIESVRRLIPYLEILLDIGFIAIAIYLLIEGINIFYKLAGVGLMGYCLVDLYMNFIQYQKRMSIFYKNYIRYDFIFKNKLESKEAYDEITKAVNNNNKDSSENKEE